MSPPLPSRRAICAPRIILGDGQRLAELMIGHNIGVSRAFAYEIKRMDSDYFEES